MSKALKQYKTRCDGLYTLPVSPFDAQIGKLLPTGDWCSIAMLKAKLKNSKNRKTTDRNHI